MNTEKLISEAKRLQKECVHYYFNDGSSSIVGYWVNDFKKKEKFAIEIEDQKFVFIEEANEYEDKIYIERISDFSQFQQDGKPLIAKKAISYPALDHIFYFGYAEIQAWLNTLNWGSEDGYNDNFPDKCAQEYESWWSDNYYLFNTSGLIAISNCWATAWPDDESILLLNKENKHLLTTLFEAEPYYEIYDLAGKVTGFSRTT